MKGKTKKILAAVLALTLIVSFAGCKKSGSDVNLDRDANLNADGTYTVVWYQDNTPQTDDKLVMDELSKYTKDKIGVVVDYNPLAPSEYAEKTSLMFTSGRQIDMCFASTSYGYEANARKKAYMDMGSILETAGQPTLALFEGSEYALECFKVGGVQFGIPVLKDWAYQPYFNMNAKYLKEAGVYEEAEKVASIYELTEIVQKVQDVKKDEFGGTFYGVLHRGNHPLLKFVDLEFATGAVVAGWEFDNYDTVVNLFETDEFMEFAKLMRDWYQRGFVKKDAATSTSDSDLWKIGNYLSGHSEWLPGMETTQDPEKTLNTLNVRKPRLGTAQVTPCGLAMPITGKNPYRTMEFINLLYTDEYVRNLVGYGIEGKHWIETEDGRMALPEGIEQKSETGYEFSNSSLGNRYLLKLKDTDREDLWEAYQKFNEDAEKSPALGFSFDPAPVSGQIAAVQNIYDEYMRSILVGAVDPETAIPAAVKAMNNVGAKEIVAEVQRQYDEWRKNK